MIPVGPGPGALAELPGFALAGRLAAGAADTADVRVIRLLLLISNGTGFEEKVEAANDNDVCGSFRYH